MSQSEVTERYSDEKGFHYETTSNNEIRDAKEAVDEAKEEIEILKIEKEISVLEDSIDGIDSKIEEVNSHYDELIEQTKNYYDQLIESLNQYKSRWEELGELKEQAEFQRQLEELGLSSVDILNMSEEAFQAFKTQYVDALDKYLQATGDGLDAVANTDLTSTADSVSKVAYATTKIDDEKVTNLSSAMEGLGDSSKLQGITDAFQTLLDKIDKVANALGAVGQEVDASTGLIGAIQSLNEAQISTELLDQFTALESAITAVTTAISGGAEGQNLPQGGAPTKQGSITPSGSPDSGGTGGLTQALEEQVEKAKELLPQEIDLFGADEESLLSTVTKVTTAIAGGGDSEGGEKKENKSGEGEIDTSHLMGALEAQYNLAEEKIPLETSYFTDLAIEIGKCVEELEKMVKLLNEVGSGSGVHISAGGNTYGGGGGSRVNGSANVNGNWSTGKGKNVLVGELEPELRVNSKDGTYEIVGQHGAEFIDTNEHDIIFNGEQTKQILKNGHINSRGKAHVNGTLPSYLRPLQEGDRMYDLIRKFDAHNELIQNQIIPPVNSIQKNFETMTRNISNVNNCNTSMQDINININGGINLQGVQDTDALAKAINQRLPNSLKQELFKRK